MLKQSFYKLITEHRTLNTFFISLCLCTSVVIMIFSSTLSADVWIGKYKEGFQGITTITKSPIVLYENQESESFKLKAVYSNGKVIDITENNNVTWVLNVWDNNGISWDSNSKKINASYPFGICRATLEISCEGFTTYVHIAAFNQSSNLDSDKDKIADSWESTYNLSSLDSADATADFDNDGMNNLLEFVLGTNPGSFTNYPPPPYNWRNEDDDGDGMPNGWEWDNGLPTHRINTNEDADGDGLTDYEEYLAGSDPQTSNKQLIQTIPGSNTNSVIGKWAITNSMELISKGIRGQTEYSFTAPKKDMYLFEVEYSQNFISAMWLKPSFKIYVDDNYIERKELETRYLQNSVLQFFSYCVLPGQHNLKFFWDNLFDNVTLKIKEIRVYSITGHDTNENGIKNWVENKMTLICGIDSPAESYISPACIEGKSKFINMMDLTADSLPISIQHGAGDRWYANIPLSQTEPTETIVSFQNDAKNLNKKFYWKPLNILLSDDIIIRKGDSILFTAHPKNANDGTMTITIDDSIFSGISINNPVEHFFETAGVYKLNVFFWGETTKTLF